MTTMIYTDIDISPSPESPPGMTSSKTSKSSSFQSLPSDDGSILADVGHFEDIGLDEPAIYPAQPIEQLKAPSIPSTRELARPRLNIAKTRPPLTLQTAESRSKTLPVNLSASHFRNPSPKPHLARGPKPRRSSWQSARARKSSLELERECDDDDSDDIPDDLILDNVPISPRPPHDRDERRSFSSPMGSLSTSPQLSRSSLSSSAPKEKSPRPAGSGTPAVPSSENSGCLRMPTWKSDTAIASAKSLPPSPLKARAKSWNIALSELSREAQALTAKLEEHADELLKSNPNPAANRHSLDSSPKPIRRGSGQDKSHKQLLLQQTNLMIDPLPMSKEKEAVLSRTRPSWLPPKDPAEERKHLREYKKMMAHSVEMEKRREAEKKARTAAKDQIADNRIQIWEKDILPRWDVAIRERRTRDLWWKGVVPRCRGKVWMRAIGNDLGLTDKSFKAALKRASELEGRVSAGNGTSDDTRRAEWLKAIRRDVQEKTWPDLKIFQLGGPLHQSLIDVLSAYAMYRSDIGYVSGCNTIAALLLLNFATPSDVFISLANILNRPLPLSFHASDLGAKSSAYNLLLQTLATKSPSLHKHLNKLCLDPDIYLGDVFHGLFTAHLPLDEAARLWDIYVFEGDSVLVRAGVAVLMLHEMDLLAASSIEEVMGILKPREKGVKSSGERDEDKWVAVLKEAGKA